MHSGRERVPHEVVEVEQANDGRVLLVGLGCLAFVGLAVAVELTASLWANSEVPGWAELVPIAWPQGLRVVWWVLVAAAALTYRRSLARVGLPQHRTMTVLTVAPFLVFAAGIAVGAEWATWH